jgi:hypothetical protein
LYIAFKSRIHLAIHYPELDAKSRRQLWGGVLSLFKDGSTDELLAGSELDMLEDQGINGRQIKNMVSIAHGLTVRDRGTLKLEHLNIALKATKDFDREFDQGRRALEPSRQLFGDEDMDGPAAKRRRF